MKIALLLSLLLLFSCAKNSYKTEKSNDQSRLDAPYLLLVSIDGYRHDYNKLYNPPNLKAFQKKGSSLKSLRPSFPTKTFPNHYTIVTGLHPESHGIVANHFYAPELGKTYKLSDRESVENPAFYGGLPIWNLASQNGMLSATYFWPGSESKISGNYPTYWKKYDQSVPHEDRVNQIIEWLKLPKEKRPHFLSLYYHDVDTAGHHHGPLSIETKDAVLKVDKSIGHLMSEVEKLPIEVNVIITSDHGMTQMSEAKKIIINDLLTKDERELLKNFKTIGKGPLIHFYYQGNAAKKNRVVNKLIRAINTKLPQGWAYKHGTIPKKLAFNNNERIGDLVFISKLGYSAGIKDHKVLPGNHGFNNFEGLDMHGIFFAKGPNINSGMRLPRAQNIHIYPFMAEILGIKKYPPINGSKRYLQPLYRP